MNYFIYLCFIAVLSILLYFIYKHKPNTVNVETRLYRYLVFFNAILYLFEIILHLVIHFFPESTGLCEYLCKMYTLLTACIYILPINYIIVICMDKPFSDISFLKMHDLVYFAVLAVIILILPEKYAYSDTIGTEYCYGPATNAAGTTIIIYTIVTMIIIFANRKKPNVKAKTLPYLLIMFAGIVLCVIEYFYPELLFAPLIPFFVTYMMYFTIENPDKRMTDEIKKEKERADKASSAKADFLSNMSHEIRTPINAIVGFSEDLRDLNIDLPEKVSDDISHIVDSSHLLLDIIGNILDISKIEEGMLEINNTEYNFKREITTLCEINKFRIANKPIEFSLNLDDSIPITLIGDKKIVRSIIGNVLSNAMKYTNRGSISLDVSSENTNKISHLTVTIKDTGRGMTPEEIDNIFTRFERAKNVKNTNIEGTGLGMALTEKLVLALGGNIKIESTPHKGSTFIVTFDQEIPEVHSKNLSEALITEFFSFGKKKILIVDDNSINRMVCENMLGNSYFVLDEAESGLDCINKITASDSYDLILMDMMMPGMDGKETLYELLKFKDFKTPVVALSADANEINIKECKKAGFYDYVTKPCTKEQFYQLFKELW